MAKTGCVNLGDVGAVGNERAPLSLPGGNLAQLWPLLLNGNGPGVPNPQIFQRKPGF